MPETAWVITLDGPAGSGKSTTAFRVAETLNFVYLDTGALYRAVAVLSMREGIAPDNHERLGALARQSDLRVRREGLYQTVWAGDEDITSLLRSKEVDAFVSPVSAVPEVRDAMLNLQRDQRRSPGLVAEGRDLGTVVFPDAHVKIFLVADIEVRAQRRALERKNRGEAYDPVAEQASLAARDKIDSTRPVAPLCQPEGAVVVDTTNVSIADQVEDVVRIFRGVSGL
jgi:cytidylate kinase